MSHVSDYVLRKLKDRDIRMSPKVQEIIREAIEEATRELSVSNRSSNAEGPLKELELRMLAERYPSLIKVCEILRERPHYTRELLDKLNT